MSAEVLLEFDEAIAGPDGARYYASACGREGPDGQWEGWIEFASTARGDVLRSTRETSQPNRTDLAYWASGLSAVYLEGSLARTLSPRAPVDRVAPSRSAYDGPAEVRPSASHLADAPPPHAVLDPFAVFAQGEDILRRELHALNRDHLANIISAYGLGTPTAPTNAELEERILEGVRSRRE